MQKLVLRSLMMLVVFMSGALFADAQATEPVKGVVRVKLQPEVARSLGRKSVKVRSGQQVTRYTQLDQALQTAKAVSISPMFPCAPDRAAEHAKFGLDRWYEISFDESVDPIEVRQLMRGVAGIEKADVKKPMKLIDGDASYHMFEPGRLAAKAAATGKDAPFNDPRLSQQWHYHNTGSFVGSVAGADINLFEAWKVTTGSPDVVVAIIDGGVDPTHEDLAQNLWINTGEIPGNGIDDDGNGYVDDVNGYNFCALSGEIYGHNHGTHVAGTVAAVNNNGRGVCGVAGGDGSADSGVRLMSCQVYESRVGVPGTGDFAKALAYAADNGAHIAQCSWGWDEPDYKEDAVLDAVRYFTNTIRTKGAQKMVGGLCIFAAGNSGITGNVYPGCMDEVLSVGAMTASLQPASYSNYGPWVDVMAPGGLMDYNQAEGVLSTLPGNSYGYMEGTSMACPHVAGIAALVLSKYGSADFPAATLKTQLETSVGDFYAVNPGQEGKYGSGYIDANKAVHMVAEGEAPDAVTDFDLMPAQESISVQWVIPASSDNAVFYHQVYYSTQPFTEETLSTAQMLVADTKFSYSGDTFTFEIPSLQPLTTYYVALRAVNRLGKTSALSPVKSAATNAGPDMKLEYTDMKLNVSPQSPVASASFKIVNDAEGLLRWKYIARTVKANISMFSLDRAKVMPFGGQAGVQPRKAQQYIVDTEDYFVEDFPRSITYFKTYTGNIGETRKTRPNAMAQLFTVDADTYPEGFNFTHYKVTGSPNGKHPIVSIYRGPQMLTDAAKIIEFDPFETSESNFGYGIDLPLAEQLYFAPGESFWVVMKFPAEDTLFPLPIAEATSNSAAATNSYMSNDDGRTWTRLSEVLRTTNFANIADKATWGITVISKNPDWATVLSLDPSEGIVEPNGSQQVTVKNDGQPMCNGTYTFNIGFTTNESNGNTIKLPVTMNVSGYEPEVKVRDIIDFGSLIIGQSKTIAVPLANTGYGSTGMMRNGRDITSTNPAFVASGANGYVNLAARSESEVEITFTPTQAGPQSGTIVLKPASGKEIRISVQGVATEPAKIAVDPEVIEVGDIDVDGDPITKTFTIKNEGKYPLQYVLPKFSEETLEVGTGKTTGTHRFGYGWLSNLGGTNGFAYDGGVIPADVVEVTSQLNDQTWFTEAIPIGFEFPFYGKNYTEIYVCSYGALTFAPYDVEDAFFGNLMVMSEQGDMLDGLGVISAFGRSMQITANTRILYSQQPDRFTVYFSNVSISDTYGEGTFPISFHISLLTDGNIEIYYDKYNAERNMGNGRNLYCGVLDPECSDGMTITSTYIANDWYTENPTVEGDRYSLFGDGTAICITAPQSNIVTSLTPADGIVSPGETVTVTVTIAGNSDLVAGPIKNNLLINSTDPKTPSTVVTINGNVVGASLKPVLSLPEAIDFGTVFRTSVAEKQLVVTNSGKRELTVSSVSLANNKFVFDFTEPVVVPAGQSRGIKITLPTKAEGEFTDVATVTTDAGSATVAISGKVIGCPGINLGYDKQDVTLPSGSSKAIPLSISNDGDEPMSVSLIPGDYILYEPDLDAASGVTYGYKAAFDTELVKCEWIDITAEPDVVFTNTAYYVEHDITTLDLPFEFSYYGKKYKKLYIYNTGFISFNSYTDNVMAPEPPVNFPAGSAITNVIAPYWGSHFPGETTVAGTYAIAYPDHAIVSWIEYGNSMNRGVCFQLILNADGTFKFQYHGLDEYALIYNTFGMAGISNDGATDGLKIPDRLIGFDDAVVFTPVTEYVLDPGASMQADITVSAAGILAGEYPTAITVNSNVPGKDTFDIPVNLIVTGQADPVFPEIISLEKVKGFVDTGDSVGAQYNPQFVGAEGPAIVYSAYLEIVNKGTAAFQIKNIQPAYKNLYDDEYYDGQVPVVPTVMVKTRMIDDITGEYIDGWMPFTGTDVSSTVINVASEPVTIALPISGEGMGFSLYKKPGVYEDDILIYTDLREEPYVVPLRLTVTESPELSVDKDLLKYVNVASDFETEDYFTISNTGKFRLDYNLKINFSGEEGGGIMPAASVAHLPVATSEKLASMSMPKSPSLQPFALEFGKSDNSLNAPLTMEYIRALYYPVTPLAHSNIQSLGASGEEYWAATAFTAPASGINISHIYGGGVFGPQHVDKDVQVYIFTGQNIDGTLGAEPVAKGTYTIEVGYETLTMQTFVAELDEPVQIAPEQVFTVMLVYPDGARVPFVQKQDAIEVGRYMGVTESQGMFMDVASYFEPQVGGSYGWIMSCIETVVGEDWVSIDPKYTSGSLEPGESVKVPVRIKAYATAKEKNNTAGIQIFSNDPVSDDNNPDAVVTVSLDKNGKPVIDVPSGVVAVNIGETVETSVTVSDPDGDKFMMHFSDNGGGIVTIKEMIPDNDNAVVDVDRNTGDITVTGAKNIEVYLKFSPKDGDAGTYAVTVAAMDISESGSPLHVPASATVKYRVDQVNRAPVFKDDVQPIFLTVGETTGVMSLADMFTDPDGDEITCTYALADEGIISVFAAGNNVIITADKVGTTKLNVTATDPAGLSNTKAIDVTVAEQSGINDIIIDTQVGIWPNPVVDVLNVRLDLDAADVEYSIFSISGTRVYTETSDARASQVKTIDVSQLPAGTYLLRVLCPDGRHATRVIVKQ